MREAKGKGICNYIGTVLLVHCDFDVAYTLVQLLKCNANKLSSFAFGSDAWQYWGYFFGLPAT